MDTKFSFTLELDFQVPPGGIVPFAAIVRLTPRGQAQCTHALFVPADESGRGKFRFYNAWEKDVIVTSTSTAGAVNWWMVKNRQLEAIDGIGAACRIWGRWPELGQFFGAPAAGEGGGDGR